MVGAMAYEGTTKVEARDAPHLGGNIREGDPFTFCPRVWDYVIDRFCIESMMDLGSGVGTAARYFFKRGVRAIAIDGLAANVAMSCYPAICHDLTKGPVVSSVDLVHCHEVVEHIEQQYLGSLLASLACGRIILMTHAQPGQGGHHHVNLQPATYWIEHISARGYNLMADDTERIRELARQDGAVYMQSTGMLFHRR
jgi:SAM-dependent methyltransferase